MVVVTSNQPAVRGLGLWLTAGAALVTVGASAASFAAAGIGVAGLVAAAAGVARGHPRLHLLGCAGLFGAVLVAAEANAGGAAVLAGTAGTVLAWDAGAQAMGLRAQLGPAPIRRALLAHVGATTGLIVVVGGATYAISTVSRPGLPTAAVTLLVLGTGLIALRLEG